MEISEKTRKFIIDHCNDDVNMLRLKFAGKSDKTDFPIDFALLQIEARRKAQKKMPSFINNQLFIFPDLISSEQASNETVARFHASLLKSGSTLLDLTAGLGIDDMIYAMNDIHVTACEINETKSEALRHNSEIMGLADRIKVLTIDSMQYLMECTERFDVVFSDPARRSETGKRLHAITDCQPDILTAMGNILRISDRTLIKCSPLLDLKHIRDTIDSLSHIYVVCLKGECKEVLIDIEKGKEFSGVTVVDLDSEKTISTFRSWLSPISDRRATVYADRESPVDYKYIYEPNSGVMKTGSWDELSQQFPELKKADSNTHLFFSDSLIEDFPGRTLMISKKLEKKDLKDLKRTKFNVVARNHPLSVPDIIKKYSLTPGGDRFLYALRYKGKPVYIVADPLLNKETKVE